MGKSHRDKFAFQNKSIRPQAEGQLQIQKMQQAIKDFEHQINGVLSAIESRLRRIEDNVANAYDLINTKINIDKILAPTQKKFFDFCSNQLQMNFVEMDADIKLNALLQWLETSFSIPDQMFAKLMFDEFDKRNGLQNLSPEENPQIGNLILMMWTLVDGDKPLAGSSKPTIYNLGCNELLVDEEMLKIKVGEARSFDVAFPENGINPALKGKSGKLTIRALAFKKRVAGNPGQQAAPIIPLNQEQKKAAWKEKYKPEVIE